jgi:hypothetical protein
MTALPFREDLKCYVRRLEYNFAACEGLLVMGDHSSPDISACIALFENIDEDVYLIRTMTGSVPDIDYQKLSDVEGRRWEVSIDHRRERTRRKRQSGKPV